MAEVLDSLGRPVVLLYASVRRKRTDEILQTLLPRAVAAVLTEPDAGHRSLPVGELHDIAAGLLARTDGVACDLHAEADWRRAYDRAQELCARLSGAGDAAAQRPVLLVCGSLYLVGAVRAELHRRQGTPEPATDLVL